jgi:hypothetical protein
MRIPAEAIIAPEKLRDYLLVHQDRSDKSDFPAVAGETTGAICTRPSGHWRRQKMHDVAPKRPVRLVWLQEHSGIFRFVTLVPKLKRS